MSEQKFWSRIRQWFKSTSRASTAEPSVVDVYERSLANPVETEPEVDRMNETAESLITLQQGQTQVATRLDDGFGQLSDLVSAVHKHLKSQDEQSAQIAGAVSQLAETVSRLPDAVSGQSEHLSAITEQLESVNARAARWDDTISQIPSLADAQRQTLQAICERIDTSQETQAQVIKSMDGFRDAVGSLSETSTASNRSIKEMQDSAQVRDERLMSLIAEQNRRFNRLFVVTIVLVVMAAASAAIVFFLT